MQSKNRRAAQQILLDIGVGRVRIAGLEIRDGEEGRRQAGFEKLQVQPAGLRSYYTAYPVLQTLGLSMSRENLLPDDETRKALNGQLP